MNARRQFLRCLVLITATSFVLAGCGGKSGVSAPKAGAKPRAATKPTPDVALTKQVGPKLAALVAAGCDYGVYTEENAVHVQSASELKWKTFPPASGTHFPQWTDFGIYDAAVNDGYLVHDMEHGGVVAWLGKGVSANQAGAIKALVKKGTKWVVAPRSDLDGLVVNAWAKSLSCSSAALAKVQPAVLAKSVAAWYAAVQSTGSASEKNLPPYHGGITDPTPVKNISIAAPF